MNQSMSIEGISSVSNLKKHEIKELYNLNNMI